VEIVAGDGQGVDVFLVYLMPVGYWSVSRTQWTVSPVVVVVLLIRSMMVWWVVSGRPRQFMVIWENNRCSIRYAKVMLTVT
jgi:hypothetical protein